MRSSLARRKVSSRFMGGEVLDFFNEHMFVALWAENKRDKENLEKWEKELKVNRKHLQDLTREVKKKMNNISLAKAAVDRRDIEIKRNVSTRRGTTSCATLQLLF